MSVVLVSAASIARKSPDRSLILAISARSTKPTSAPHPTPPHQHEHLHPSRLTIRASMGRSERSERDSLPPNGGAPLPREPATGGAVPSDESGVRSAASCDRATRTAPIAAAHPLRGAWSWVWPNPLGALVLVSWPDRLGGVFRYPPGTVVDPPRLRLRQCVA